MRVPLVQQPMHHFQSSSWRSVAGIVHGKSLLDLLQQLQGLPLQANVHLRLRAGSLPLPHHLLGHMHHVMPITPKFHDSSS